MKVMTVSLFVLILIVIIVVLTLGYTFKISKQTPSLSKINTFVDSRLSLRKKKPKRLMFVDFWSNFNPYKPNVFTNLLSKYEYKYTIVSSQPDILIYSVFGNEHQKYGKCKRVFYSGEHKQATDKSLRMNPQCHLSLTFYPTFGKNIRFPYFFWVYLREKYPYDMSMSNIKKKKRFCSFVYSNNRATFRNKFCLQLSKYKKVACGGKSLNNIGYLVKDKINFQRNFKFGISFENSTTPDYVTEKILETYASNTVPIYFGSVNIKDDFNPQTFINGHDFRNYYELINYIKRVDNDDALYQSFFNKPILSLKWRKILSDPNQFYLKDIVRKIYADK